MIRPVLLPALLALAACGQAATGSPPKAASVGYDFPALTGRVVDRADLLPAAAEVKIAGETRALERATGHQLVVVTVPTLGGHPIEDYARELGNAWGVGRKGVNDGVLIVVAPNEHRVRIAVGEGLETTLTNAEAQRIIDTEMLPPFRSNDFVRGIEGGVGGVTRELGRGGA